MEIEGGERAARGDPMTLKDLLVHVDSTDLAAKRIGLAIELAVRYGARLTGLFAESGTLGPSLVARRDPDLLAKVVAGARASFEEKVRKAGIESGWWHVEARDRAELVDWTVQCCRYVDLAVFGPPGAAADRVPEGLVEQVVFQAGRPVLAVPAMARLGAVGERVLVAWTGSSAAARAVNDALPILERAKEVTLLSLQLPGKEGSGGEAPELDIAAHLRAHGIRAACERFILGELGAVDHVLNRTMDVGADLIVMGAHAGRGLPHLKHEDTTAALLRSMTAPVLLSH